MKKIVFFFSFLVTCSSIAQSEFNEFENGLIYSPEAISKLQEIVGDKNEAFRKCDLSKEFYSFSQTKGFFIEVKSNTEKLVKDLQSNITLDDFLKKYEIKEEPKFHLIVKSVYKNYRNEEVVEISEEPEGRSLIIGADNFTSFQNRKWIFKKYKDKSIGVFYLDEPLISKLIPRSYARMIQYSECLIDTTTTIHPKQARKTGRRSTIINEELNKRTAFFKYIDQNFDEKEPEYSDLDEEDYELYYQKYRIWDRNRTKFIKENLSKKLEFKQLLEEACSEAILSNSGHDELEGYIASYYSKEKALELKRGRIVYGSCSQDQRPRIHAMNIAQLSAESYNWDVFLRAHLNIMNDRFHRNSDGSYAWARRETYIKELEVLNINVSDLIYGISFRVKNPSKNHYYSNIRRVGRALAESDQKDEIASELVKIIKDSELDDYNRLIMFYLYHNFRYNQKDTYTKSHIEYIASLLPDYLRPNVKT
ncbi:hypothetical protein [Aquimarina litoralis]|uniref:hypothetical protein n=1 Tax=Aquimarina litoralis TaxID=584605 RepID=UPI001C5772D2|nr:hypothetical protein [Aquimarina litoralis]MBW1295866.1 hypothetical protein [Aquimarina litoralis]